MKFFIKLIVLICLLMGNLVYAENILVLPVDLYCNENYYLFPEVSEIVAQDVIDNFNSGNKLSALTLYDVRKKLAQNPDLKSTAKYALNKYKYNSVDFVSLKKLAKAFNVKSVLLISSLIIQDSSRRNVWEVMEISSAFEAMNNYPLETSAVLVDDINDLVMWSGKYKRLLGDSEARFWAKSSAQANSQLEKLRYYSKDIVSKNISQAVVQRIYPKTMAFEDKPVAKTNDTMNFKPNPLGSFKYQPTKEDDEIQTETIFEF